MGASSKKGKKLGDESLEEHVGRVDVNERRSVGRTEATGGSWDVNGVVSSHGTWGLARGGGAVKSRSLAVSDPGETREVVRRV